MSVNVQLRPSGKEFRVEHGETVLEAALRKRSGADAHAARRHLQYARRLYADG